MLKPLSHKPESISARVYAVTLVLRFTWMQGIALLAAFLWQMSLTHLPSVAPSPLYDPLANMAFGIGALAGAAAFAITLARDLFMGRGSMRVWQMEPGRSRLERMNLFGYYDMGLMWRYKVRPSGADRPLFRFEFRAEVLAAVALYFIARFLVYGAGSEWLLERTSATVLITIYWLVPILPTALLIALLATTLWRPEPKFIAD